MSTFHTALRCGECHDKMYDEWQESSHSRANRSATFKAMRAQADAATCDRCHAPMRALADDELSAREGVTCEVCHRISEVQATHAGAGFVMRKAHDVKYGPLCDANYAYFHRTECLPLYTQSLICGGCHLWYAPGKGGGEIPVYTEYEDWQKGPYAKTKQCQACHMPGDTASIAVSEIERKHVPHHSFMGRGDLRDTALEVSASVSGEGDLVTVRATVKNARAGHPLPAGMSGRQIVLRARIADGEQKEAIFERRVVDASGAPVPFYRAERVAEDTRIGPKASRDAVLELHAAGEGELSIELVRRAIAPEIAKQLGLPPPEETTIAAGTLKLAAPPQKGRRPGLPKRVAVKKP